MIYLDLDNLLIDSIKLAERTQQAVEYLGITADSYKKSAKDAMKEFGFYSPQNHYTILRKRLAIGEEFLQTVVSCAQAKDLVFPDTHEFLFEFDKENLAILTSGDPKFQLLKIRANGLDKCVKRIYVTRNHKPDHIPEPAEMGTFFLDDVPREIEKMKRRYPQVFCVQARKVPFWESQKTTAYADAYATTLIEAAKIIKCSS